MNAPSNIVRGVEDPKIYDASKLLLLGSPELLRGRLLFSHFFLLLLLLFFQIAFIELKKIRLIHHEKGCQITEK